MSKKRRTDPTWVKLLQYGVPQHDHSHGECDLEQFDENLRRNGTNYYKTYNLPPMIHPQCSKLIAILSIHCFHYLTNDPSNRYLSKPGSQQHYTVYDRETNTVLNPNNKKLLQITPLPACTTKTGLVLDHLNFVVPTSKKEKQGWENRKIRFLVQTQMERYSKSYAHTYNLEIFDPSLSCNCDSSKEFHCTRELPMRENLRIPASNSCYCCEDYEGEGRRSRNAIKAKLHEATAYLNAEFDVDDMTEDCEY